MERKETHMDGYVKQALGEHLQNLRAGLGWREEDTASLERQLEGSKKAQALLESQIASVEQALA